MGDGMEMWQGGYDLYVVVIGYFLVEVACLPKLSVDMAKFAVKNFDRYSKECKLVHDRGYSRRAGEWV